MDKDRSANLKISPVRASLSSCGGLLQAVWIGTAFFYASFATAAMGVTATVLTTAIGGLLSAACIPLIYLAVNRTRSGLWGRYHLTLAIFVIFSAMMCSALFASQGAESTAARITSAAILLPLFAVSVSWTAYVGASIGNRLTADDGKSGRRKAAANILGVLIGVALCSLPFTGLSADSIGYALASLIIVAGAVVYFASVDCLPRFVRPLQKKPTFAAVRDEFFKKPKKTAVLSGAAYFLFAVSALLCVGYMITAVEFYDLLGALSLVCLAAATVLGIAMYFVAYKKQMGRTAAIVGAALSIAAAVAMLFVLRFAPLPKPATTAIVIAAFCTLGIGSGLSLSGARNSAARFAEGYTVGAAYCLEIMALTVATAAAVSVSSALAAMTGAADILFACVVGALCAAAAVLIACAYGAKEKEKDK